MAGLHMASALLKQPTEHAPLAAPGRTIFQSVKPFIAAGAVIATGSILIAAIFFTLLDLQWIAFLAGIVFASVLAMTTQAARSELVAAGRAERLALAEYQLGKSGAEQAQLKTLLDAANARLRFPDEALPAMLAFVDGETRYRYHNRAFRDWLGLPAGRIDGQHMRDVLGRKVFADIEAYVAEAAAGRVVRYERTHKAPDGTPRRMAVQYLPEFSAGKFAGFHVVITDVTERREQRADALFAAQPALPAHKAAAPPDAKLEEKAAAWQDASRSILAAIDGNEFALLTQSIRPLAGGPGHFEVLIRLLEEESGQVPPGAFFPLAEEHGLLPRLDRWVFSHVLDWVAGPQGAATARAGGIYFINVATATLGDPDFAEFAELQLRKSGVPPGAVCLEIAEADLILHQGDAVQFGRAMKACGCRIAISGFGRNPATAGTLKLLPVDFLKIDGGIVRQVLKYPAFHARAVAIARVARALGVRTIAEMVEDDAVLAVLVGLQIDFAQGFGISKPALLGANPQ